MQRVLAPFSGGRLRAGRIRVVTFDELLAIMTANLDVG